MRHCSEQWEASRGIPAAQAQAKSKSTSRSARKYDLIDSHSNPVRAAYLASLETQISSLRDELANLYKTQGQNAQRLLSMNETLREKEELTRIDSENLRKARDEIAALRRKVDQHAELMAEKDRTVQVTKFDMLWEFLNSFRNQIRFSMMKSARPY
jgi:autophagy-related protein 16